MLTGLISSFYEPSFTRSISSVLFHNSCDKAKFPTFFFTFAKTMLRLSNCARDRC